MAVLFREGVPDKELSPAVLMTKGPIYVNGVGNTTVQVNDEWMCTVPLVDGSKAVLEGLTTDQITAHLPIAHLAKAEDAVKSDAKSNIKYQVFKHFPKTCSFT